MSNSNSNVQADLTFSEVSIGKAGRFSPVWKNIVATFAANATFVRHVVLFEGLTDTMVNAVKVGAESAKNTAVHTINVSADTFADYQTDSDVLAELRKVQTAVKSGTVRQLRSRKLKNDVATSFYANGNGTIVGIVVKVSAK